MDKFRKVVNEFIVKNLYFMECFILSLMVVINVFYTCYFTGKSEHVYIAHSNITNLIVFTILVGFIIFLIYKLSLKIEARYFLIITLSLDMIILLFWFMGSKIVPFADQAAVYKAALNFNMKNYSDFIKGGYLYQYNHQISLVMVFSFILKLFKSNYRIIQVINIFCVIGLHLGVFKLAKEIFDEKTAKIALIISMMFLPTTILIIYVYGDISGLFFAVWSIYFTVKYVRETRLKYILYSSLFMGISMLFRTNNQIIWVALVIYLLIQQRARKFAAVIIIVTSLLYNFILKEYAYFSTGNDVNNGIPAILFVNMGLQEGEIANGWYNGSTVDNYISAQCDKKLASEKGMYLVKERVAYMSENPAYAYNFFKNKFISTWAEPTYQSLFFTLPHGENKEASKYMESNYFLNSLYYGKLHKVYISYSKGLIFFIIVVGFTYNFFIRKKPLEEVVLLFLPLMGAVAFHLVWETKSRYVFPYIVLIIPVAASYCRLLFDKIHRS